MTDEIPFHVPDLRQDDAARVAETIQSGWLTTGPVAREFEGRFANAAGASHAVAVNSCTAALHLALAALDIGPGDEVIVPTLTFTATAEVVLALGATPVLADVRSDDLNLNVDHAASLVTSATRAIMPVHYGGQAADMDAVLALAADHDLFVVEDAAHAFPATYRDRPVGSIGDATAFSFYANKTLTTGEGGMLTTEDNALAERARRLALHGMSRDAWTRFERDGSWDYAVIEPGYKYNMPDTAAALGIGQLDRAAESHAQRAALAERYRSGLEDIPAVRPLALHPDRVHAWHLMVVLVDGPPDGSTRSAVAKELGARGLGTSVHYRPLHLHPLYREAGIGGELPVADRVFPQLLSLPLYPKLGTDGVDRVLTELQAALEP